MVHWHSGVRGIGPFENGISHHSGKLTLCGVFQYSMHMAISMHANSGITHKNVKSGGSQMVKVVSILGVSYTSLSQAYE